jgi:DNA-binding transcriptional regulator YiaG
MTPDQIKRYRERLDLSQAEFAAALGVAQSTVSRWEAGETRIPVATVMLLKELHGRRRA